MLKEQIWKRALNAFVLSAFPISREEYEQGESPLLLNAQREGMTIG